MVKTACRILKGVFVTAWMCVSQVQATTYYVDPGCVNNGSGNPTSDICGGTTGPKKTFGEGLAKLSLAGGDTLYLRGKHSAHGSGSTACAGFDGNYRLRGTMASAMEVDGKAFAAETIISAYGWTAVGARTEEKVIQHGGDAKTWIQCSDCSSTGSCPNVNSGAGGVSCSEVYKVATTGTFALSGLGIPTYKVSGVTDMGNAHAGYIRGRCSWASFKPCEVDIECSASGDGSCSLGIGKEYDSYHDGTTMYVRWGSAVPSGSGVVEDSRGGLWIRGTTNLTVRGIIVIGGTDTGIMVFGSSSNINIVDCRSFFINDTGGSQSDYGMASVSKFGFTNNITFRNIEIAYTRSEGMHLEAAEDGTATNIDVIDPWIHDLRDLDIMGVMSLGTAQGMIWTDDYAGYANFTGSEVSGGIIDLERMDTTGMSGALCSKTGIRLEQTTSGFSGLKIHDNIIENIPGSGILFACESGDIDSTDIYNNLFIDNGTAAIDYANTGSISNSDIYNNTFRNSNNVVGLIAGANSCGNASGAITNQLIRNNIFSTGSAKGVSWSFADSAPHTGNKFEYNLVQTTANPAVTWFNTGRACNALSSAGTGNLNGGDASTCPNPLFVSASANNFHLQSTSPAIDVGTTSIRTKSINNTLAELHGLPDYSDNLPQGGSAWDMGATEGTGTNMLTDGDFESGAFGAGKGNVTSPCTCAYGLATITNVSPIDGTYSAKMASYPYNANCDGITPSEGVCWGLNWQFLNLTVGQNYRLSGNYKFVIVDTGSSNARFVVMCTESNCSDMFNVAGELRGGIVCTDPPGCQSGVTQPFAYDFVASSATVDLKTFLVVGAGITSDYVLLDNLVLAPFTVTP